MPKIVDELRAIDDANARFIALFGAFDYEIEYIRDDIKSQLSKGDIDEGYRQIVANQISGVEFEKVIGKEFKSQTLFFEDMVMLVIPSERYQGILASFDRHETLPINRLITVATQVKS